MAGRGKTGAQAPISTDWPRSVSRSRRRAALAATSIHQTALGPNGGTRVGAGGGVGGGGTARGGGGEGRGGVVATGDAARGGVWGSGG